MKIENFPILLSSVAHKNKQLFFLKKALEELFEAHAAGSIRNAVLLDLKQLLSNIASDAWSFTVQAPFFHSGKYKEQPQEVQDLDNSILIMGLHDVISASKKVAKCHAQGPAIEAMRAFCSEVLPLSLMVASLKDKVVKGRAPSTGPAKPVNPDKVVKTCPVCFRAIAVKGATMAHHGYKRPGEGFQTSSCAGIRFRPLEVSSDGLKWLIDTLGARLNFLQAAFDARSFKESLPVLRRVNGKKEISNITRETPDWKSHFRDYVNGLEFEMGGLKRELVVLDKRLADWAPGK